MLKFDEQKQLDSVNGALALRGRIEEIVDAICAEGYKNICWLGIGGTWASALQAEVHMKEKSAIEFFSENAAEYVTTGNKRVGKGTIVILSSVTGSTIEMVEGVKKAQADGAKVFGFIDKAEADIILAFERLEAYRALPFLKKNGKLIVNDRRIDPMPVITGAMEYPEGITEEMKEKADVTALDALALAEEAGSPKAVNVVMIGLMAKHTDIAYNRWVDTIKKTVPAKLLDINLKAFDLGYQAG